MEILMKNKILTGRVVVVTGAFLGTYHFVIRRIKAE